MEHYGIRGLTQEWFKSYLTNRMQFTQIDNHKSNLKTINTGVPQGSVLGPLLFLLYVNDISNAIKNKFCNIMLFADTNVFVMGSNLNKIKNDTEDVLHQLCNWFKVNRLTLNLDKTNYSIFHPPRKKIPANCNSINIDNIVIHRVEEAKYLGMYLDDHLNWKMHVKSMCENLTKYASSFKLIKHLVPNHCKKQLYYAFVYSRIKYGIEVYGFSSKGTLKTIQVLQNRILKILYNKDWYTPTDVLHRELNLLQITDIFKLALLQIVYKQTNNLLPDSFNEYFRTRDTIHSINTRNASKLHIVKSRTNFGKNRVKSKGAYLFNNLPDGIVQSQSLNTFKKKTKAFLLSKYL